MFFVAGSAFVFAPFLGQIILHDSTKGELKSVTKLIYGSTKSRWSSFPKFQPTVLIVLGMNFLGNGCPDEKRNRFHVCFCLLLSIILSQLPVMTISRKVSF